MVKTAQTRSSRAWRGTFIGPCAQAYAILAFGWSGEKRLDRRDEETSAEQVHRALSSGLVAEPFGSSTIFPWRSSTSRWADLMWSYTRPRDLAAKPHNLQWQVTGAAGGDAVLDLAVVGRSPLARATPDWEEDRANHLRYQGRRSPTDPGFVDATRLVPPLIVTHTSGSARHAV